MHSLKPCLTSFVRYKSLPGAVLLVDRRDRVSAHFAVGTSRRDSIFQIQSMTKPFLAVAVLMLVEEKKIPSIDTKVVDLPGFEKFPFPTVRIRQLLTHTSGYWPMHQENGEWFGVASHLTNRLDREPGVTIRDKPLEFVVESYWDASKYPLQSTNYAYSNKGFELLALIIEKISGQPVADFVEQRICRPLGMSDTFFFATKATPSQRARVVDLDDRRYSGDEVSPYDKLRTGWVYPAPAGALYSTASDLRQFLRLIRYKGQLPNGPRLLSPESVELLSRDLVLDQNCGCGSGHTAGFFYVRTTKPQECDELPGLGVGSLYHGGRFLTYFWFEPNRDEIGIYLVQRLTPRDYTSMHSFLGESQAMFQMLARIP
jgi:CubicO group peptidase (beta-lactamase class C family)